ncbi:hypothetical protein GCM10011390_08570 [Aureimonas endophytica]|uniref:Uncharacterized protein n=1 Tax=Aureimonas endophytica TaxID=2027858 RepID=A0A916ZEG2_9HYPH|nr:hypothetical protein [Aureimonas endophytica]GGD92146.1 hypothetical protein GCM10011390_08570 [Aureimonas endophytica]
MTPRYFERATRNHSRQGVMSSDAFDRLMDHRQRRAARHCTSSMLMFCHGGREHSENERRFRGDFAAPSRA